MSILFDRPPKTFVGPVFVAVVFLLGGHAQAFGPVTHAYIASQVIRDAPGAALFGAMAADMNDLDGWNDKLGSCVKHFTHFEADKLSPSPFQRGLLTHNSSWGADSYAHAYFHMPTEKLYPLRVYEQLSQEFGITMNNAEDIIEAVIDYVVCRDLGPAFMQKLIDACDAVGPAEEQALVAAFAKPVSEKMPEFTEIAAARVLGVMFEGDKYFLKRTAEFMCLPDKTLVGIAPLLFSAGFNMDMDRAGRLVRRAVELCGDWRPHIDDIAREIATKMPAEK
jgi:hypothetical protein